MTNFAPISPIANDEISLKDVSNKIHRLAVFIFSKWLLILALTVVGGFMGLVYAYHKPALYTAEITFVLEESQSSGGLGSYTNIAGQFGIDLGGSSGGGVFAGNNLLALMKSRSMIQKALLTTIYIDKKNITLAEFYIKVYKFREKWIKNQSALAKVEFSSLTPPSEFTLLQNAAMTSFYKSLLNNNLKIEKPDKETGIISVQVTSENEMFSKYFAEALTKEVSNFYIETKTKRSAVNLSILQHQTDSVKNALNYSIRGVAASNDANPNPNPALQVLRIPSQRKQFDVQVNQAILTQLIQNLEVAKVSLRKEMPLIQIIDKPTLPLEIAEFSLVKGFILGSLTVGFLTITILVCRRVFSKLFT